MSVTSSDPQRLQGMFRFLGRLPPGTACDMARMYSEALVSQVELMRQGIDAGQAPACTPVAHKLVGSAAIMRDEQLAQSARAMERALMTSDVDAALVHWAQVQADANFTLQGLRERYPGAA